MSESAVFNNYTHVANLWNCIGVRTRNPITKEAEYFKVDYKPRTYTKCSPANASQNWRTIDEEPLRMTQHASLQAYRTYCSAAEAQGKELFGVISPIYQFIAENVTESKMNFEKLRAVFLDIEVESRGGFASPEHPYKPITAISVEVWGQYLTWGCGDYTPTRANITYAKCDSEIDMLESFVKWWTSDYPDVITGWNVQFYDMPYIMNRIDLLKAQKSLSFKSTALSPWGKTSSRPVQINGQSEFVVEVSGISILDYLELYRKFSLTQQESYKLDYIAEVELNANKLNYEEYGTLQDLADQNWQRFIEYNIKDIELVRQLNDKLHHLDLCVQIAYSSRVNFTDTFKQVRMWDAIIYYDLYGKQIAIPTNVHHDKNTEFAGAYVKDPQVGKHSWIASFDVNSLYPSIIREWNISSDRHLSLGWLHERLAQIEKIDGAHDPVSHTESTPREWLTTCTHKDAPYVRQALEETISLVSRITVDDMLDDLHKPDPYPFLRVLSVCITPNNQIYRVDNGGFLPEILARMYADRKSYKSKMIAAQRELELVENEIRRRGLKVTK